MTGLKKAIALSGGRISTIFLIYIIRLSVLISAKDIIIGMLVLCASYANLMTNQVAGRHTMRVSLD